jgi:hypothetical protein
VLPPGGEVRRLFREQFAGPFARDVAAIAARPIYGARERRELEAAIDRLGERQKELASRIFALGSAGGESETQAATDQAVEQLGESLLEEVDAAGVPLLMPDGADRLRFHAVLVMPVAIVRANTCAAGDTAEWDFEEADLFGRGYEMSAVAESR